MVRNALRVASRAPSIHNSQPWHWVFDGHALHLYLDHRRLVSVADRSGREAIISCGAVLDHARIAMEAAGWQAATERFPDPDDRDRLAILNFRRADTTGYSHPNYERAMLRRRTYRLPLRQPAYWSRFLPRLEESIEDSVVRLDEISDESRPQLARVSHLTASLRHEDPWYENELRCWTAPFALYGGVPPDSLATGPEALRVDVRRDFPAVSTVDRRRSDELDASRILVLSTADDSRMSVLRSGEALSQVLLECTMAGYATCTLTHLIELDESRELVRCVIDHRGEPQALIRVGLAPPMEAPPVATPRLPLSELLEIR
ncbi:Acg family FMN-binding oxidoreductase [Mycobacterium paraterrae]|uniref:Acg family FMN-binding oxidoreductase n=1 Tax=Mycobacterium paraterrae TaxID=577492 RepID=UPI003313FCB3